MPTLDNNQNSSAAEIDLAVLPDLQISYGAPPIMPDNWSDEQKGPNPYAMYYVTTNYSFDRGTRVLPIAGPEGTRNRVVRLFGGRCQMRVAWEVRRLGKRPVLPGWKLNADAELLEKHINPDTPNLMPDGISLAWRIQGLYVYELLTVPGDDDSLAAPLNAVLKTTLEPTVLESWQFNDQLLNLTTTLRVRSGPLV